MEWLKSVAWQCGFSEVSLRLDCEHCYKMKIAGVWLDDKVGGNVP